MRRLWILTLLILLSLESSSGFAEEPGLNISPRLSFKSHPNQASFVALLEESEAEGRSDDRSHPESVDEIRFNGSDQMRYQPSGFLNFRYSPSRQRILPKLSWCISQRAKKS